MLAGDDNADRMLEFYRERYDTIGIFENKVYDGVAAALDRLRARGDRLFVATSKRQVDAQRVVKHFGLDSYFDGVYGANSDGRRRGEERGPDGGDRRRRGSKRRSASS